MLGFMVDFRETSERLISLISNFVVFRFTEVWLFYCQVFSKKKETELAY